MVLDAFTIPADKDLLHYRGPV
ncbi:hypothetical protein FRACA_2500003 [Frankia canadensis]|uniref:Uncharacterized protein n=1 Tax=Frankia canadensis TaxID=1836972 RepID=A0A2I2KS35_9ACTN|nr:hypothetical protein FRACA_2500003 [Frankia canadensis]SOU55765.1 hypothetical protein FRACA_2500003 [Frankia canadensis]